MFDFYDIFLKKLSYGFGYSLLSKAKVCQGQTAEGESCAYGPTLFPSITTERQGEPIKFLFLPKMGLFWQPGR